MTTDWQDVYRKLNAAGYSDEAIRAVAGGLSRNIICKVRNGTYKFQHDPGHEAGSRLLNELAKLKDNEGEENGLE